MAMGPAQIKTPVSASPGSLLGCCIVVCWAAITLVGCGGGEPEPTPTPTTGGLEVVDDASQPLRLRPITPESRAQAADDRRAEQAASLQKQEDEARTEVVATIEQWVTLMEGGDPQTLFYEFYENDGNLVRSDIDAFVDRATEPWGGRLLRGFQQAVAAPPEAFRWGRGFDSVTINPGGSDTGGMHLRLVRGEDGVWRFLL